MTLRARLTIWYAGAMAVILVLYAAGVYAFLRQSLYAELDRQLHDDFEVSEEALERDATGAIRRRTDGGDHHDPESPSRALEVWAPGGALLYREGGDDLRLPHPEPTEATRAAVATVASTTGTRIRVHSAAYAIGGETVLIHVARSEARLRHELSEFLAVMALGLPLAVVLACAGGYVLAGRALAPVGRMAATARTITADRLEERLVVENPNDELGRLADVFNETLARLEHSFSVLRRFTADAAHELRTPLTALKSVGEVGLRESRDEQSYRDVVGSMLEETDRLVRLVDDLLGLARSDRGEVRLMREPTPLAAIVREVVEHLAVLAEEKNQALRIRVCDEAHAHVDARVIRRAFINLLDNAIKYGAADTEITIDVARDAATCTVTITDRGPGIAQDEQSRIFDRFYRVDPARVRSSGGATPGGAGLGLALAKWAVEAHDGRIEVASEPGLGATFRVVLPAIDHS